MGLSRMMARGLRTFRNIKVLPVGDLRLKAFDLGVLDVDVIVDELRAEFLADERVLVQGIDRLAQTLWAILLRLSRDFAVNPVLLRNAILTTP